MSAKPSTSPSTHSIVSFAKPFGVMVSLLLTLTSCRAPGMKFNTGAFDKDMHAQVNGLEVTLRPLNPATLQAFSTRPPENAFQELVVANPGPYRIGPLDTLMVTVWDHPELNSPLLMSRADATTGFGTAGSAVSGLVVDDSGCLYYPYAGRLKVAGLTSVEARELLTAKLELVLQKPQVDLKVIAFRSQKVFISGEVRTPAQYNITDVPFTLAEAINRAGGFLPTANQSRVDVSRGNRTWSLNFFELLIQGNHIARIMLKDGDSVHVHLRDEEPVYLLGEVRNPRSVPTYNGRLSLAQALSDSGGINSSTAETRSIYVFRRGKGENTVDVFHLDAYNPVAMVLADRFALQPRDVVYVDAGPLVRWNRVVGLLAPTVTALSTTASDIKYLSQ